MFTGRRTSLGIRNNCSSSTSTPRFVHPSWSENNNTSNAAVRVASSRESSPNIDLNIQLLRRISAQVSAQSYGCFKEEFAWIMATLATGKGGL
jgi:hypothetical protein